MVELNTVITLKFPSNNLSKYSLFIDGSSLIDSIKPLLAFVGQTCCGAFRNTTDLTAVKQGYAYTFTANRVHTNVIKVIATVVYEKSTEVYEYDLTKSSWSPISIFATKDDLGVFLTASGTKAAVFKDYVEITNLKLYAGHTYLVLGKTGSSISVSLISARVVSPSPEYGSAFNFLESRTTGSNGGGCVTAAIITLTKDYTVPLQGYGYDNATYDYSGFLMAIQLK